MTEQENEPRDKQLVEGELSLQKTGEETLVVSDAVEVGGIADNVHHTALGGELAVVVAEEESEEETWTNQPKESFEEKKGQAIDCQDADEEDDKDPIEDEREAPVQKRSIRDARDVLMHELVTRAGQAKLRLKPYLSGTIGIEFSNSGEQFLLDWRGEDLTVCPAPQKLSLEATESSVASVRVDCFISLTEINLMAVRKGDLNPQVAMIADKIKVRGKVTPAVYLFNLIAPRVA